MDLDLTGKTVSQAIEAILQAMEESQGEAVTVRTDNEVVKLNLLNRIVKMGLKCTTERKAAHHYIKIAPKPKPKPPIEARDLQPAPWQQERGIEKVEPISQHSTAKRAHPTSSGLSSSWAGGNQTPTGARQPSSTPRPVAPPTFPTDYRQAGSAPPVTPPTMPTTAQAPGPQTRKMDQVEHVLAVSCDQIGQKDNKLGFELLMDYLGAAVNSQIDAIVLVHRGVRLLDPRFNNGQALQLLAGFDRTIFVCRKSADFYDLETHLDAPVKVVDFGALVQKVGTNRLHWI